MDGFQGQSADGKGGGRQRLTLVIVYHVAQVVSAAVVCFAHRHGVVREVDIAVIALIRG